DRTVTGVQTCALPISSSLVNVGDLPEWVPQRRVKGAIDRVEVVVDGAGGRIGSTALDGADRGAARLRHAGPNAGADPRQQRDPEIGRASCRERGRHRV